MNCPCSLGLPVCNCCGMPPSEPVPVERDPAPAIFWCGYCAAAAVFVCWLIANWLA
jgi:hypothetical protein